MTDNEDFSDRTMVGLQRPAGGRAGAGARMEAPPAALQDFLSIGLNRLVEAAAPLLLLAAHVRDMFQPPDLDGLRNEATRGMREFEERARGLGVPNDMALTARYLLCTAVDEAVLNTPWGDRSAWGAQTLLMIFHREAWGGEKFFQVVDRASTDPARYIDLLELAYICLALGFAGKYRVDERGPAKLADVQHALYQRIANTRGSPERELSPHWKGAEDRRNPIVRYVPLWVVAAGCAFLLIGVYTFFYLSLANQASPLNAGLAQVGLEAVYVAPPPPPAKPPPKAAPAPGDPLTLKRLLAAEEAAGLLDVVEFADRSVVSLHGEQFASGAVDLKAVGAEAVKQIAVAVNRLPGNLLIQGHSDDQPLRSLRYANNYELSTERAKEVGRILQRTLAPGISMDMVGRGPDLPRCTPPDTRDNRACNRRVEIIHLVKPGSGAARAPNP